jgi:hypothetical protein
MVSVGKSWGKLGEIMGNWGKFGEIMGKKA